MTSALNYVFLVVTVVAVVAFLTLTFRGSREGFANGWCSNNVAINIHYNEQSKITHLTFNNEKTPYTQASDLIQSTAFQIFLKNHCNNNECTIQFPLQGQIGTSEIDSFLQRNSIETQTYSLINSSTATGSQTMSFPISLNTSLSTITDVLQLYLQQYANPDTIFNSGVAIGFTCGNSSYSNNTDNVTQTGICTKHKTNASCTNDGRCMHNPKFVVGGAQPLCICNCSAQSSATCDHCDNCTLSSQGTCVTEDYTPTIDSPPAGSDLNSGSNNVFNLSDSTGGYNNATTYDNTAGNYYGNMAGNYYGNMAGNYYGNTLPNYYGNYYGNMTGNYYGNTLPNEYGNYYNTYPNYPSYSNANPYYSNNAGYYGGTYPPYTYY